MATPTVSLVTPNTGFTAGGEGLTISGSDFEEGCTATIGGSAVGSLSYSGPSTLTGTSPGGSPGAKDVVVTNPGMEQGTLPGGFTINGPDVTQIAPTYGTSWGGTSVTISGTGFVPGVSVTIGGSALTGLSLLGDTTITGSTPAGTLGQKDVVVTNPGDYSDALTNGYTYGEAGAPSPSNVNPMSGTTAGGTPVSIGGINFAVGDTVTFGGTAATNVLVVNQSTITCDTPAHAAGTVDVVVTGHPSEASGTLYNGYTYEEPPPPSGDGTTSLMGV